MSWNTQDELQFLKALGYHRDYNVMLSEEDQLNNLKAYRRGAMRRVEWGQIDKEQILSYVNDRISTLSLSRTQPIDEGDKT